MPKIIVDEFSHIEPSILRYCMRNREKLRQRNKKWRSDNPEKTKENYKKSNERVKTEHPEQQLFNNAKYRAKRDGLEFSITIDDIIIPEYCPVLSIRLKRNKGKGRNPNSPTLDRVVNTLGYVPGNVCVISYRANALKSNGTLEEMEKIVDYMKEFI